MNFEINFTNASVDEVIIIQSIMVIINNIIKVATMVDFNIFDFNAAR
jgi:hypothetical protein